MQFYLSYIQLRATWTENTMWNKTVGLAFSDSLINTIN